jgi:hypothetical protein
MSKPKTITIDDVEYVRKSEVKKQVEKKDGLTYCILRTFSAGVWMGWVDYDNAPLTNCEVIEATRIWRWEGAFTLSNLAAKGTTNPKGCRLATDLDKIKVNNVIEFLPVSENAKEILDSIERE